MKQSYDALLFDIDGVLVDVSKSYREAIRKTARFFLKRPVSMQEVAEVKNKIGMNNDWDATYALIKNKDIPYQLVKSIFQEKYLGTDKTNGLINNEKLLITKKQLTALKDMYRVLGIVTGRPKKEAEYTLHKNKIKELFDVVVAMEDTQRGKPFPDPILKAIDLLNIQNTVYIGDSPSDVLAAEAAKIPSIYIGNQNIGTIRFQSVSQVIKYLL